MIFKKCSDCSISLLFKKRNYFNSKIFCNSCYNKIVAKVEAEDKRFKQKELENIRKANIIKGKIRGKNADEILKKELELNKLKSIKKGHKTINKKLQKFNKPIIQKTETKIKKTTVMFTPAEIHANKKLLYIEADVKRLKVIEWKHGKKRVVLNKEREVRKSHAGGFSQEKFQKFVKFKKSKSFDWIVSLLERPGVLRRPYDKVKVVSRDFVLKENIEKFLK